MLEGARGRQTTLRAVLWAVTLHDALAGHAMDAVGVAVGKTAGGWAEGNFQAATTLFAPLHAVGAACKPAVPATDTLCWTKPMGSPWVRFQGADSLAPTVASVPAYL